jgi:hypothetical protein
MADQLPQFQGLNALGSISGIAGIALIAEEAAALVAKEAAAAGGGKYQFTMSELQSVLKQWQDLGTTIQSAKTNVHHRVPGSGTVMAPGNENASDVVANAAHTTNVAYQDYLNSMETYVQHYVTTLQTALQNYGTAEDNNSALAASAHNHLQA